MVSHKCHSMLLVKSVVIRNSVLNVNDDCQWWDWTLLLSNQLEVRNKMASSVLNYSSTATWPQLQTVISTIIVIIISLWSCSARSKKQNHHCDAGLPNYYWTRTRWHCRHQSWYLFVVNDQNVRLNISSHKMYNFTHQNLYQNTQLLEQNRMASLAPIVPIHDTFNLLSKVKNFGWYFFPHKMYNL